MDRLRLYAGAVLVCVALLAAGCGDDNKSSDTTAATTDTTTEATTTTDTTAAAGGKPTTLKVAADPGGQLKFDKSELSASAGKVTISMDNPSDVPHAVAIEGNGVDVDGKTVNKGGVSTATADLKPGKYEFYCPVDSHKQAGMEGKLTVK
jgi:plastocyanin